MAYLRRVISAVSIVLALALSAPAEPRRIVSLYPGHTDNIVALGAGDRLTAVSRNDDGDLPPGLTRLPPKVGAEAVLALRPDAVFMRSLNERTNPHLREVLERAGVAVHVIDPPSWDGFESYLVRLAAILGTDSEEARRRLRVSREAIRRKAAARSGRPGVFLEATGRELHTCAPDSWAARLLELAGGVNAAPEATPLRPGGNIAPWGVERILRGAESLDVYLVQQGPMNAATPEEVRARPWFSALGHAHLATVPESLLSRPSLSGLEKGGALLLKIFEETVERGRAAP